MPEQVWYISLLFFALGHLGLVIRILFSFIASGQKRLGMIDDFVTENGAVFLLGLLSYWGIVSLWLWTDAVGFLGGVGESIGIVPGQLNGWAVIVAIVADFFLKFIIDKFGDRIGVDKISDKIAQKMGKDNGNPPPTP